MSVYGFFYRALMKLAHRFDWHYAPAIYPDGDTQLWCKWCGFRATIKHTHAEGMKTLIKVPSGIAGFTANRGPRKSGS